MWLRLIKRKKLSMFKKMSILKILRIPVIIKNIKRELDEVCSLFVFVGGGVAQLIECQDSDRKIAKP